MIDGMPSTTAPRPLRGVARRIVGGALLAAAVLSPSAEAQSRPSRSAPAAGPPPVASAPSGPSYLDFAISTESVELTYRALSVRHDGYYDVAFLANEDDDYALSGRVMRMGALVGAPVRLGVGIAGYLATLDDPNDTGDSMEFAALALTGRVEHDLAAAYRASVSAEISVAPDITTFGDGESLIDFEVRASVDIGRAASAFIGYHALEVDVDPDHSLDKRVHIGVSLAF